MHSQYNQILALDTATGPTSVAVWRESAVAATAYEPEWTQQSRKLVTMVEASLGEAGIGYADLDLIVTTIGPGSFTGLRIGLATARALGFAAGVEVKGVTTLAAIGYAQWLEHGGEEITAAIPAGKGQAYTQRFLPQPRFLPLDEAMLVEAAEAALSNPPHPDARILARLACEQPHLLLLPVPFYIREPDAKLPTPLLPDVKAAL